MASKKDFAGMPQAARDSREPQARRRRKSAERR